MRSGGQAHAPAVATPALVLRAQAYGESDRIVTLLTATHGKVTALARWARSSRKRFGAALSPFGFGEAMLRERRGQDLWLLEDLHCSRGFSHLPQELSRYSHACYACELCLHLCPPHEPEPRVLQLTLQLLELLDGLPLTERASAEPLRIFELQLLQAVGLGLQLDECAACGQPVPEQAGESVEEGGPDFGAEPEALLPLDVSRGGILCLERCWLGPVPTHLGPLGGGLSATVRQALQHLSRCELSDPAVRALSLPPSVGRACKEILLTIMQHHLGRNLRAVEFIAKMNAFGTVAAPV